MRYFPKHHAQALFECLHHATAVQFSLRARNFLANLKKDGGLKLLPRILAYLEKLERSESRRELISVRSAEPLSPDALRDLAGIFHEADVREAVGKELLGGATVEWEDFRIDASIRGRLQKLQSVLGK